MQYSMYRLGRRRPRRAPAAPGRQRYDDALRGRWIGDAVARREDLARPEPNDEADNRPRLLCEGKWTAYYILWLAAASWE